MSRREPFTATDVEQRSGRGLACDVHTHWLIAPLSDEKRQELARLAQIENAQAATAFLQELESVAANYRLTILTDEQERPTRKAEAFRRLSDAFAKLGKALEALPEVAALQDALDNAPMEIRMALFRSPTPLDEQQVRALPRALRELSARAKGAAKQLESRIIKNRSNLWGERRKAFARDLQTVAIQHSKHLQKDWSALRAWLEAALKAFGVQFPKADARQFDVLMLRKAADGSVVLPTKENSPPPHKKDFPRSERGRSLSKKLGDVQL